MASGFRCQPLTVAFVGVQYFLGEGDELTLGIIPSISQLTSIPVVDDEN